MAFTAYALWFLHSGLTGSFLAQSIVLKACATFCQGTVRGRVKRCCLEFNCNIEVGSESQLLIYVPSGAFVDGLNSAVPLSGGACAVLSTSLRVFPLCFDLEADHSGRLWLGDPGPSCCCCPHSVTCSDSGTRSSAQPE